MRRLLLDTHLVLWWLTSDRRLGSATRRLIETSTCAVSVISLAEIAMKAATGKLKLPPQPLSERLVDADITILSLNLAHLQASSRLMGHHADPFDCLLVGTALAETMSFATRDQLLLEHAAPLLGHSLIEA